MGTVASKVCLFPLALLAMALSVSGAKAGALPAAFVARYSVHHGFFPVGYAKLSYRESPPGRYEVSSVVKASGLAARFVHSSVTETSRGSVAGGDYRPSRYEYHRNGSDARDAVVRFDWGSNRLISDVGGQAWSHHLAAGTLDRMAMQLELMSALRTGLSAVTYRIADGGPPRTYRWRVQGVETIEVPAGRFRVTKVAGTAPGRRDTTLWCAPALDYLPVRIQQRDASDGTATMTLQHFSGIGPPQRQSSQERGSVTPRWP